MPTSFLLLSLLVAFGFTISVYYLMRLIARLTNRWIATLIPALLSGYFLVSSILEARRCDTEPIIVGETATFPPGCDGPGGAVTYMWIYIFTPILIFLMLVLVARLWSRKPIAPWWS